jgi:hypothetical protein
MDEEDEPDFDEDEDEEDEDENATHDEEDEEDEGEFEEVDEDVQQQTKSTNENESKHVTEINISAVANNADFDYDPESARGISAELEAKDLGKYKRRKKKPNVKEAEVKETKVFTPAWQTIMQLPKRLAAQQRTKQLAANQVGMTFEELQPKPSPRQKNLSLKGNKATLSRVSKSPKRRDSKQLEPPRSMSPQTMASFIVARSKSPLVDWQTPIEEDEQTYDVSQSVNNALDKEDQKEAEKQAKLKKQTEAKGILEGLITSEVDKKPSKEESMENLRHKFSLGLSLKMALWLASSRRRLRNRYEQARRYIVQVAKKRGIHTQVVNQPLRQGLPDEDDEEEYTTTKKAPPPHYHQQGNLQMYTTENIRKRLALKHEAIIQEVISQWWNATLKLKNKPTHISKRVYMSLCMAVYTVMMPASTGKTIEDARRSAEDDWIQDSRGSHIQIMDFKVFYNAIFQLADIWCESIELNEYVTFLSSLFDAVYMDATLPKIISRHIDQKYIKQLLEQGGAIPIEKPVKEKPKKKPNPIKTRTKRLKIMIPSPVTKVQTRRPTTSKNSAKSTGTTSTLQSSTRSTTETPSSKLMETTSPGSNATRYQNTNDNTTSTYVMDGTGFSGWNMFDENHEHSNKHFDALRYEQDRRRNEENKRRNKRGNKQIYSYTLPFDSSNQSEMIDDSGFDQDEDIKDVVDALLKQENDRKVHRALLELLNQNDDFILERTIFSRMIACLNTDTPLVSNGPVQLGSELVNMLQSGVISNVHQSYMRRKNKINPLELMQAFIKLKKGESGTRPPSRNATPTRPFSGSVITKSVSPMRSRPSTASDNIHYMLRMSTPSILDDEEDDEEEDKESEEEQLASRLVSQETWSKLIELSNSLLNNDHIEELQQEVLQENKVKETTPPIRRPVRIEDKKIDHFKDNEMIVYEIMRSKPPVLPVRPHTGILKKPSTNNKSTRSIPSTPRINERRNIVYESLDDESQLALPPSVTQPIPQFVTDILNDYASTNIPEFQSKIEYSDEVDEYILSNRSDKTSSSVDFDVIIKNMDLKQQDEDDDDLASPRSKASDLSSWWDEDHDHTQDVVIPSPKQEKDLSLTPKTTAREYQPIPSVTPPSIFTTPRNAIVPETARSTTSKDKEHEFRVVLQDIVNNNPFYVSVRDEKSAIAERLQEKRYHEQLRWERLYGHKKSVFSPSPPPEHKLLTRSPSHPFSSPQSPSIRKTWFVEPSFTTPPSSAKSNAIILSIDDLQRSIDDAVKTHKLDEEDEDKDDYSTILENVRHMITAENETRPATAPTTMRSKRGSISASTSNFPTDEQRKTSLASPADILYAKRPVTASANERARSLKNMTRFMIDEKEETKETAAAVDEFVAPVQENLAGIRQLLQSKKRRRTIVQSDAATEIKPVPLQVSRLKSSAIMN